MDESLTKKIASDDLAMLHDHIISIQEKLEHDKENLHENKNAKLWLTYTEMVNIVCKITKVQRTGNWILYVEAISECLPYFTSTGHYLYAKLVYLYLQSMNELSSANPDVYQMFMNGHHVVRRHCSSWAGVSTDLVIEKELMSPVKKTGGLTRGRGMIKLERAKWLLSTPARAEIKRAIHSLSGN